MELTTTGLLSLSLSLSLHGMRRVLVREAATFVCDHVCSIRSFETLESKGEIAAQTVRHHHSHPPSECRPKNYCETNFRTEK